MFREIWAQIKEWFFKPKGTHLYMVKQADETPDLLVENHFYLVGQKGYIWCGVMLCPCGCKKTIHLNLLPKGSPKWAYRIEKNKTISIYPSIWRSSGCRSHFFLNQGKIHWCKPNAKA
jgi:hypothetical protein